MSDNNSLFPFTNNGSPTPAGQRAGGTWEALNYTHPSGKQSWESASDFNERMNSFNQSKKSP